MRHDIDWHKVHAKVGQKIPVYPFKHTVEPFIGVVEKITINKYGRISYVVNGKDVFAEELFPAKGQTKLKMRAT